MHQFLFLSTILFSVIFAEHLNEKPSDISVSYNGEIVDSLKVSVFTSIDDLNLSCSGKPVTWSITPELPKSLTLFEISGIIRGKLTEALERTEFTIQATNASGSAFIVFPITVKGCEGGILVYPKANEKDDGWITIKQGEKQIYTSIISSSTPICLYDESYEYRITCDSTTSSHCYFLLDDNNDTVFLSVKIKKTEVAQGPLRLIPDDVPTPVVESNPVMIPYRTEVPIYFSTSTVHTGNITFTPTLPPSVYFDYFRSSLMGVWPTVGVFKYVATSSNSKGEGTLDFTVAVGSCLDNKKYVRLFNPKADLHSISLNITNSKSELIYQCEAQTQLDTVVCMKEDSYTLDMTIQSTKMTNSPLIIYDALNTILGYYEIKDFKRGEKQSISSQLNLISTIAEGSSMKYSKRNTEAKWTEQSFNDSMWASGTSGNWGVFDSDQVFFRKKFDIPSDKTYYHYYLDINCKDKVTVFINKQLFISTEGMNQDSFTHFSIPITQIHHGSNILAIMIERTKSSATTPIQFDIRLYPIAERCIGYSFSGIASADPGEPLIDRAFDGSLFTSWSTLTLPITVTYTFENYRYEMINRVDIYASELKNTPVSFQIVGIQGNSKTVLKEIHSNTLFFTDEWVQIHFDNQQVYNQYGIVFMSAKCEKLIIHEIKFYSCVEIYCKKEGRKPLSLPGETYYSNCPLGSVGKRKNQCIENWDTAEWEEDRSSCLSKNPPKGKVYVDSIFTVYNITIVNWNVIIHEGIKTIVSKNLPIQKTDIELSSVMDIATNETFIVSFSMRYIVDEKDVKDLKMSIPQFYEKFDHLLKRLYCSDFKDIAIELKEGPTYHTHKDWLVITLVSIICVLVIVICVLLYKIKSKKGDRLLNEKE